LEPVDHLLLLCKEPFKGRHPKNVSITRFIQQKAARSMPSGLPGSKFMRDEKPLLSPGAPDPTKIRLRPCVRFRTFRIRNPCTCVAAATGTHLLHEPNRSANCRVAPLWVSTKSSMCSGTGLPDVTPGLNLLGDLLTSLPHKPDNASDDKDGRDRKQD
jgi:hypothetical protein